VRRARAAGAPPQTPAFNALLPGCSGRRASDSGPPIPASGSALGSLASVALSSVRLMSSVARRRKRRRLEAPMRIAFRP